MYGGERTLVMFGGGEYDVVRWGGGGVWAGGGAWDDCVCATLTF